MENNKPSSIDIKGLRWGRPPVPLLPRPLCELWANEALPDWLASESGLPAGATVVTLGSEFWNYANRVSPRLQHFVEFTVKSRFRSIENLGILSAPWPAGLGLRDLPLTTRSAHVLSDHGLLDNKEKIATAKFGQLIQLPRLGIRSLLEITCMIEAALELHWQVTRRLASNFAAHDEKGAGGNQDIRGGRNIAATPARDDAMADDTWSALFAEILSKPWVDQIDEHDARFRRLLPPGVGTVEERLERVISDPSSTFADIPFLVASLPKIRDAAERLMSQPLEESLLELLAVYHTKEQPRLNAIAERFGWLGEDPKTLQECGDTLGVTRERIRQIEAKILKKLKKYPLYLPQLDAGIAVLEATAPIGVEYAARLLVEKGVCARPFSAAALIATAEILARKTTLHIAEHEGGRIVVSGDQDKVLGAVIRAGRKLAGASGVASIYQLVDSISDFFAPLDAPDITEDKVRRILRGVEECEFLNDDWFWFFDIPPGRNRLENVTKKILSVASPQSVGSIREGVRRVYRWRSSTNSRYRNLVVPPAVVLARFIERHPSFTLQGELVTSVSPLDYRKHLGEGEQVVVDVLRGVATGVVDRRTLVQECIARGVNENTVSIYTTYSAILEHIGIDLWQLRGVKVDPAAIEAVREQNALRPREKRMQDFGWTPDGKLWIAWSIPTLSGAPVFGVPGSVKRYLSARSFKAKPKGADRGVGNVSINDAGMSYGFQPFFRYAGADQGDSLLAEFDLAKSEVVLSINDEGILAAE